MNNLLIVSLLAIATVIGFIFLIGAAAQPTGQAYTVSQTLRGGDTGNLPPIVNGKQDIFLQATRYGTYSPRILKVRKDVPVRIHFSAELGAGCGHTIIFPEFGIQKNAPANGEALIEFTPTRTGRFPFHCSMKMFNGTMEVVE